MKMAKVIIPLALIALAVVGCNSGVGQSTINGEQAAAVYEQLSPSIVYIDTPTGTGSGIYIDGDSCS
jgi:hypothetical protein